MVQHLFDKMAGIIRNKKADRAAASAGAERDEIDRLGQTPRNAQAVANNPFVPASDDFVGLVSKPFCPTRLIRTQQGLHRGCLGC